MARVLLSKFGPEASGSPTLGRGFRDYWESVEIRHETFRAERWGVWSYGKGRGYLYEGVSYGFGVMGRVWSIGVLFGK